MKLMVKSVADECGDGKPAKLKPETADDPETEEICRATPRGRSSWNYVINRELFL